jgi:periplasmic divalent cation tolerance protein
MADAGTPPACLLLVTAPPDAAAGIAEKALLSRTVACANVLPGVTSRYWWKGALESASESLILFKTTRDRVPDAMAAIRAAHPYDVPEILAVAVDAGLPAYLEWVAECVRK